ncbi:hypothetical protein [Sphingomonas sp. Leaf37]|uniref:hypothetical protein n=1 Tax=Sphingomonas sp. Leaf37 TaxID=2876552 RepID=UPI001E55044A|nr:hypothetical protein [Sphingomonas sp. Leaf37]
MVQGHDESGAEVFRNISLDNPAGIPNLLTISDDKDSLTIRCSFEERGTYEIVINDVFCYKKTEERFMLSTVEMMHRSNNLGSFAVSVSASRLVKWLEEESLGTTVGLSMSHIKLFFSQDIVDIILSDDAMRGIIVARL